jgi:hypothetical protein
LLDHIDSRPDGLFAEFTSAIVNPLPFFAWREVRPSQILQLDDADQKIGDRFGALCAGHADRAMEHKRAVNSNFDLQIVNWGDHCVELFRFDLG